MKKRQKHSTGAWALQIILTAALIAISAFFLASNISGMSNYQRPHTKGTPNSVDYGSS